MSALVSFRPRDQMMAKKSRLPDQFISLSRHLPPGLLAATED